MGWILETNRSMNRGMEAMGGHIVKRFRVYERQLVDDARHRHATVAAGDAATPPQSTVALESDEL